MEQGFPHLFSRAMVGTQARSRPTSTHPRSMCPTPAVRPERRRRSSLSVPARWAGAAGVAVRSTSSAVPTQNRAAAQAHAPHSLPLRAQAGWAGKLRQHCPAGTKARSPAAAGPAARPGLSFSAPGHRRARDVGPGLASGDSFGSKWRRLRRGRASIGPRLTKQAGSGRACPCCTRATRVY